MKNGKLFDFSECPKGGEIFDTIVEGAGDFKLERTVSRGAESPDGFWYDQDRDELVAVISGSAVLEFEKEKISLGAGDWVVIKKGSRHRVAATSENPPCVWLTAFGNFK